MVNLLSNTWTAAEQLAWRQKVVPPLCGLSLALSVIAQIVFHIFPRMRVFPRNVMSWVGFFNIFWDVYMIWKWSPGSALSHDWSVKLTPGSGACKAGIFIDNFTMNGFIACNTLITLTIFLVVVIQLDMTHYMRRYYAGYVLFVLGFPLTMALVAALSFVATPIGPGSSCSISDKHVTLGLRLPGLILLGIQMLLLTTSLFRMHEVYNAVESSSSEFPMGYLIVRFFAIYCAQLFNIFPTELWATLPSTAQKLAIFSRFVYVTHCLGGAIDALVLLFGNIDFISWLQRKYAQYRNKHPPKYSAASKEYSSSTLTPAISIEMSDTNARPAVITVPSDPENDEVKLVKEPSNSNISP